VKLDELQSSQLVTWMHQPRGGYGYIERIPGKVVKVGEKLVQIEVRKKNGEAVTRWVDPKNLEKRG
jgi:hypothetical protein